MEVSKLHQLKKIEIEKKKNIGMHSLHRNEKNFLIR